MKQSLYTDLDRPGGFQEVEAFRFQDSRAMKVLRLSALSTDTGTQTEELHN